MELTGRLTARCLLLAVAFFSVFGVVSSLALLCFWWCLIPAWVLAELVVFPIAFLFKWAALNRQPLVHAPAPSHDPRDVFNRFVVEQAKLSKYICIKEMLRKWFYDVPISDIKKGNVADLLTYGFFYKSREQLESEGQAHLPDQLVQEIEQAWGVEFEPGYNKGLPFMNHLWQGLRCHYRPLSFYLVIEVLFALKHCLLLGCGFRAFQHRGFLFYTYGMHLPGSTGKHSPAATAAESQTPLLFLHGVGLGVLPYLPFVLRLAGTGRPVLAVECHHLGMRWVAHCPAEDEVVDAIVEILDQCGVRAASVVAHSYGTFMASRLVQRFRQRVQSLVLIDPVCFVMFSGKLIKNFVYQPHKSAITTWFVARDVHHAASVCRHFYWSLLNLWPDQLPEKTLVVLSGQDELVPVQETMIMLAESSAKVLMQDHHCHAEFIKDIAWQDKVVAEVALLTAPAAPEDVHEDVASSSGGPAATTAAGLGREGARRKHHAPHAASNGGSANGNGSVEASPKGAKHRKGGAKAHQQHGHGRTDSASSGQSLNGHAK